MNSFIAFLVEGPSDSNFIEIFKGTNLFKIPPQKYEYATKTKKQIRDYIRALKSMRVKYFFLCDLDHCQCVAIKKQKIIDEYPYIDPNSIVVVVKEIEGWYIAGNIHSKHVKMLQEVNAEMVTKEYFNTLIPKKYQNSATLFMSSLIENYDLEDAKRQNKSLDYFVTKLEKNLIV